jgi:cobalt-zinc-cadmium efflux system membrane fusion protein
MNMSNGKKMIGAFALLLASLALGYFLRVASSGHEHDDDEHAQEQHGEEHGHEDEHGEEGHGEEARTHITANAADAAGVQTAVAGPAVIRETVTLYGTVRPSEERIYDVTARFGGVVREVNASVGETVKKGQTLAFVENNESLQRYAVTGPADGVILSRRVNAGDAADGTLFTLANLDSVWVDFAAFPQQLPQLATGQTVHVINADGEHAADTKLDYIAPIGSPASQSVLARAVVPNPNGRWTPGLLVTGEVTTAVREVPLAVKVDAVQMFRDDTVVFEKCGDAYEARPLELGMRDEDHVEVLEGIEPGTEYVSANSYLIKADLLKSGAAHAH